MHPLGPQDGDTPLHKATLYTSMDVAALLVQAGADLAQANKINGASGGCTPLLVALDQGMPDFAALYVNHGANVNAVDAGKDSVLHKAARSGLSDILVVMIKKGAVPDINKDGEKPSDVASGLTTVAKDVLKQAEAKEEQRKAAIAAEAALAAADAAAAAAGGKAGKRGGSGHGGSGHGRWGKGKDGGGAGGGDLDDIGEMVKRAGKTDSSNSNNSRGAQRKWSVNSPAEQQQQQKQRERHVAREQQQQQQRAAAAAAAGDGKKGCCVLM